MARDQLNFQTEKVAKDKRCVPHGGVLEKIFGLSQKQAAMYSGRLTRAIFACWVSTLLLTACGGGSGGGSGGTTYNLSGQVQKGPFAIGSQVSVNELDGSMNPTGKVYNVQTTDDLGNFSVASKIGSHLVEMVGDGFYMDDLTGQLAASRLQLKAIADLSVNSTPTINVLTSLQVQRLKKLISQGSTYAAANTQSQNEVLVAFGIDSTKINSLSTMYSMKINGNTDADSVLLAVSSIISKMATNEATTNSTTQPAELSNYISTIAAQIANTGTLSNPTIIASRNLAATQIDLAVVRTNIETYYKNRGLTIVAPKFEEWVDKDGSGILPRRLVQASGLTFSDVSAVEPQQQITSNAITMSGFGTGVVVPASVNTGTTIIKNGSVVIGSNTTVQNGDTLALRITSLGYGMTNSSTISVGSTSAMWYVTTKQLGGTITGLGGNGLVLLINGGDNITILSGSTSFSFPSAMPNGATYSVSVLTNPSSQLQICTVSNGTGTVGPSTSNISIACNNASAIVYVGDSSNGMSAYATNATTGVLTSIGTFAAGNNSHFAIDPSRKFLYVASSNSAYTINAGTGALNSIGTFTAGTSPVSVAIDPTGKFAYVANYNSNNVSAYTINATSGALTNIGTFTAGTKPVSVVTGPTGKFVYVANTGSNNVSAYTINADTGTLTPIGTFTAGNGPWSIAVEPSGKFAYVVNYGLAGGTGGGISAYTINPSTGVLTSIGTFSTGAHPWPIAIDPTGKFAYVGNSLSDNIAVYAINATTGALTSIGTTGGVGNPISIVVDTTGKFAYVLSGNNHNIVAYAINATTGSLSSIGTIAAGSNPYSIAIRPLP